MEISDSSVVNGEDLLPDIANQITDLAIILPKIEITNQTKDDSSMEPNLSTTEWNELKTLFTSDATTEVNEFLLNEDNASEFLEYLKMGLPQTLQTSDTTPSGIDFRFNLHQKFTNFT